MTDTDTAHDNREPGTASQRLQGRVAIITGSRRGIGRAIAEGYAREGAKVVLVDIDEGEVQAAADAIIAKGGTALGLTADVGNADEVDNVFRTVLDQFGTVDIVVNNAGITWGQKHFFDVDDEWWDETIRVNLTGHYLVLSRAARIMAKKGGGVILNTSSGGATRAHRGLVPYDASKGGIEALTRAAAVELGPYGIRVNTLVPGLIATTAGESEELLALRDATVPLGRGGQAEDMVGAAIFLASDEASYVSGIRLPVDGAILVQQRSPQVDTYRPEQYPTAEEIEAFA